MPPKFRVVIAGIGGVGGFYGGTLAAFYEKSKEVEIHFIARGQHLAAIRQAGLKLVTDAKELIALPRSVTDNPSGLNDIDLVLFCCKSFDYDELARSFSSSVSEKTLLLPLSNGVDNTERLQKLMPEARSLYGCVYLFSSKEADGVVKTKGDLSQLLFGNSSISDEELIRVEELFRNAGLNISRPDNIKQKIWEKFSFVSPLASVTSDCDCTVGDIFNSRVHKELLFKLLHELVEVADQDGIKLPNDIIETNIEKMSKLPHGATTSMHTDFIHNRPTELETLTGFVVKRGVALGIDTPAYHDIYARLKTKTRTQKDH